MPVEHVPGQGQRRGNRGRVVSAARISIDADAIRRDFPILSRTVYGKPLVYLDNAATSHKPRGVIRALSDYYEGYNSNVHRGVHALSMEATDRFEEARSAVARFINAESPDEVIWTRNATEAINLVAHSWPQGNIEPGGEIVTTEMEHHSNLVPWQKVARGPRRQAALPAHRRRRDSRPQRRGFHHQRAHEAANYRPQLQLPRNHQPGEGTRRQGQGRRRRRHDRRRPERPAHARGRPGLGLRFPHPVWTQDARTHRHRRSVRQAGCAGDDGAVPARRRDGAERNPRGRNLERAAHEVRGRHAQHRRRHRGSARPSNTSRPSAWTACGSTRWS